MIIYFSGELVLPAFVEELDISAIKIPKKKISAGNLTINKTDFDSQDPNAWVNDQVSFNLKSCLKILIPMEKKKILVVCKTMHRDKYFYCIL